MEVNNYIKQALESLNSSPLKTTKQRVENYKDTVRDGNNHFTAEDVHNKIENLGLNISLATVYNCLNRLTDNGIVKSVKTSCNKIYFDTNITAHHHFFVRIRQL